MMKYGFFDTEVYTYEKINKLSELIKNDKKESVDYVSVLKTMAVNEGAYVISLSIRGIGIVSLAFAALLYMILNKKNKYFGLLLILFAALVCFLFLYIKGRYVYRVLFPILFSAFTYLLYLLDFEKIENKKIKVNKTIRNILIYTFSVLIFVSGLYLTSSRNLHIREDYYPKHPEELTDYMNDNSDKKFEILCGRVSYWTIENVADSVFYTSHLNYDANYIESVGTYYASPYFNYRLNKFGTDNFYSNALNDNIYIVIENNESQLNHPTMMKRYLQKYYSDGKTVKMEVVQELSEYTIYNYTLS